MKSSRPGPVRMPRDQHPLPRRERCDTGRARTDSSRRRSDSISRSRASVRGSSVERLDLLQEHGDRLFEFEGFRRHRHRVTRARPSTTRSLVRRCSTSSQRHRARPTTCSTSAISADDGRTRICDDTSALTRSRLGVAGSSISNETRRSPRWREKISPSASNRPRSAGTVTRIATSRASRSRTLSSGDDLRRQHPHRLVVALELAADEHQRAGLDQAPRCADRPRETRSPRRRPARPRG